MANLNDAFLARYNELDEAIREKYGQSNNSYSAINYYIGKLRKAGGKRAVETAETLDALRELRNSLVHMVRIKDVDPFTVSKEAYEALGEVLFYLIDPPLLYEAAIPLQKLLICKEEDSVLELSRLMAERGISHVPLLKGKKVVGVYSESCLFRFLVDHPEAPIEMLKIKDLGEYVEISEQREERYVYVPRDYLLEEAIREYLYSKGETGRRLGLFLITENGRPDEALLYAAAPGALS